MKINELHAVSLFPKISDREQWEPLKMQKRLDAFRNAVFTGAEKAMADVLPELSATRYMDFVRNGNRDKYEKEYFSRRSRLENLVLAEAFEYKGRYTDRIIDHLWAILNEPTWCLPAHTGLTDPLPDFETEHIDLFSAETSMVLAQTLLLMEDELTARSQNLVRRLRRTLLERAVVPVEMDTKKFWWLSGDGNWSVWICSNLFNASMAVLADDPARLSKYAVTLLSTVDRYVEKYHEDGGCDEGPSYWSVSPARMFLFLEAFYRACDGNAEFFDNPKIRRMGEFIADLWIDKDMFVPFADAAVHNIVPCGVVYKYAERVGSEKLRIFALRFRSENAAVPQMHSAMLCTLAELFWMPRETGSQPEREDFTAWYPVLQATAGRHGRILFAAKAGDNGEHHNHNDVGQFIIAVDGKPLVIDLGRSEYTRFTFSNQRYENFILNSFGHNVLSFDNCGQLSGKEHAAKMVKFTESSSGIHLSMELSGCYPPELGLKTYSRDIEFDFQRGIIVADYWESSKPLAPQLPLYTSSEIINGVLDGKLRFSANCPYECRSFDVEDCRMREGWGPTLWKTQFEIPCGKSGSLAMRFDLEKAGAL